MRILHFALDAACEAILKRLLLPYCVVALGVTALVLYAWPTPTIFYEGVVALHLVLGVFFLILAIPALWRLLRRGTVTERTGWAVLIIGGAVGAAIIYTGARRPEWPVLYTHIAVSLLGCAFLASAFAGSRGWFASNGAKATLRTVLAIAILAGISWGAWWVRTVPWQRANTDP